MFKRIVLTLLIVSPFLSAIFIGYPVKSFAPTKANGVVFSRRCFKVGEFQQFIRCFQSGKRIAGIKLLSVLHQELSSLSPLFDLVLVFGLVIIFITVFIL